MILRPCVIAAFQHEAAVVICETAGVIGRVYGDVLIDHQVLAELFLRGVISSLCASEI